MPEPKPHPQNFWFSCSGMKPEKRTFFKWCPGNSNVQRVEKSWTKKKGTGLFYSALTSLCRVSRPILLHFHWERKNKWYRPLAWGRVLNPCDKEKSSKVRVISLTNWRWWGDNGHSLQLFEGLFCKEGLTLSCMVQRGQALRIRGSHQTWPKVLRSQLWEEFKKTLYGHLTRVERRGFKHWISSLD